MDNGLLDRLTDADRRTVIAKMSRRTFRKGDTLFHEGDPGDSLHVITKGHVAIRTTTLQGDVMTLAIMGPGEFFGEQALLDVAARRTASAVALDTVETRALHRNDFDEMCQRHPTVQQFLVSVLAAQVRRLSVQLIEALHTPADRRVVRRLRDVASLYRSDAPSVDIPLRQEDLASMAGTTRPTVNRVLKDLEKRGVLSVTRGHVHVLEPDEIERLAR